MFRKIVIIASLALVALLSGCAVPMAKVEDDAKAKAFNVAPGKANVYVYRNEHFGGANRLGLELDGKEVGKTGAMTYAAMEVKPGKHTIVSKGENDEKLDLVAEVGKNYFVWQEVKMGVLSARSKLHLVDEKTGRAGVGECKLIEMAK